MARVRLLRDGQVTLPAALRQKLKLAEGDYLDAEVVENGLLLRPVAEVQQARDVERMFEAKSRVRPSSEQATKTPAAEEQEIFDEVRLMRREYARQGGTR